jgi:hypothetical protein
MVADHSLEKFNLTISPTDPGDAHIVQQDFRTMPLYRANGTPGRIAIALPPRLADRRPNDAAVNGLAPLVC